ncbi:MAG: SGNH/GDSL hydrolase family protein [Acidimicrobiia bacterium]
MRRFLTSVIALVLILAPAGTASADPPEGPVYLALGESLVFGEGTPVPEHLGYVAVLDRRLKAVDCRDGRPAACPLLELVNLGRPGGVTVPDLIGNQLPPALQLITDRKGDDDPGNDVVLITVSIGGNDLFAAVVGNCLSGPTDACAEAIATVFAHYSVGLAQILVSLRAAAGPETQIVVMTYDNPLEACFLASLEPFGDIVLEGGGPLAFGFNDIIRAVAAATDADVADIYGQLEFDDWVGGQDCKHPDISGHQQIARIFEGAITS